MPSLATRRCQRGVYNCRTSMKPTASRRGTFERLARSGISPRAVLDVLYGTTLVRRHIGSALQVFGQDRAGSWLAVALIEEEDDHYVVFGARRLDDTEISAIE